MWALPLMLPTSLAGHWQRAPLPHLHGQRRARCQMHASFFTAGCRRHAGCPPCSSPTLATQAVQLARPASSSWTQTKRAAPRVLSGVAEPAHLAGAACASVALAAAAGCTAELPRRLPHGSATARRGSHSKRAAERAVPPKALAGPEAWAAGRGCVYVPELLPAHEFTAVAAEYRACRGRLADEGPSYAEGRLAALAPRAGAVEAALGQHLACRLQDLLGLPDPLVPLEGIPIEYREYRPGVWMEWHTDVALTEPPQVELVYTVENCSDSKTRWARSHLDVDRGLVQEVWTAPNSGLFVQASGAVHMVSELTVGRRAIVKAVFAPKGAHRTEEWDSNLEMIDHLT